MSFDLFVLTVHTEVHKEIKLRSKWIGLKVGQRDIS